MNNTVQQFKHNVSMASYHHADDSTKEWAKAKAYERKAREIFESADDETKEELRKIAKGELIGDWWK